MPTWAERLRDTERAALAVSVAAALVLCGDAAGLHRASGHGGCAPAALPPPTALDVSIRLAASALEPGDDVRGEALVTNRTSSRVLLSGAQAVVVTPGTRRPLTWADRVPYGTAELLPGTFATVPFVLHVARCRRGEAGSFPSGFYEVVLLLTEKDHSGAHQRASAPRAVIISP